MNEWKINEKKDEWMKGWKDEWKDEWMKGWINEWINLYSSCERTSVTSTQPTKQEVG